MKVQIRVIRGLAALKKNMHLECVRLTQHIATFIRVGRHSIVQRCRVDEALYTFISSLSCVLLACHPTSLFILNGCFFIYTSYQVSM